MQKKICGRYPNEEVDTYVSPTLVLRRFHLCAGVLFLNDVGRDGKGFLAIDDFYGFCIISCAIIHPRSRGSRDSLSYPNTNNYLLLKNVAVCVAMLSENVLKHDSI